MNKCRCRSYTHEKYGVIRPHNGNACCSGAQCVCGKCPRTLMQAMAKYIKELEEEKNV